MRVVVDTNVLVSGIINPRGFPGQIVEFIVAGEITLIASDAILAEYREILLSKWLFAKYPDIPILLALIEHGAELVSPRPSQTRLIDPDDQHFLDASEATGNAIIVTGNPRHFQGIKQVMPPKAFVELFSGK